MQVHHILASCPFQQIVHILRQDYCVVTVLPFGDLTMSGIGFGGGKLDSTRIVKSLHERKVRAPSAPIADLINGMIFPKAILVAKRAQTAFCTESGPSEDHEFWHEQL